MHAFSIFVMLGLAMCPTALTASATDWRSKTIYQIMTDRFALTNGSTTQICDTGEGLYCGGSWQGIVNQLDYVQDMGFDAIWISPVTQQVEGNTIDGSAYHGYWQTNIIAVNEHFGTADDIKSLAAELHSRNMYLMVDLVVNHYAYIGSPDDVDYGSFVPFNEEGYFHTYCSIDYSDVSDTTNIETCWMGDTNVPLPDLRTEASNVSSVWNSWVTEFVSNYSIDGLRLDSAMEVNTGFWSSFQDSAGVYSVGEVDDGDSDFVCSFQEYLPGVMNYAMYFALIDAFQNTTGSIPNLSDMISTVSGGCSDSSLLGTFSENHDNPRFASLTSDMSLAKNVIAFTMLTDGIPIIYQGQEQHYTGTGGGSTPYNREALWLSGYDTSATLYQHVKSLNAIRHQAISADDSYTTTQNTVTYSDYTNLGMQKGSMVTVVTNTGADATSNYTLSIPSSLTSTDMTELLTCDTLTTASGGNLTVPMSGGLPRVYLPTSQVGSLCDSSSKLKPRLVRSRLFSIDEARR